MKDRAASLATLMLTAHALTRSGDYAAASKAYTDMNNNGRCGAAARASAEYWVARAYVAELQYVA
jgi:hypothetical protein